MNTSKYRLNAVDDKTIRKEGTTEVVAQPLLWYEIWMMRFCRNMKIFTKRTKPQSGRYNNEHIRLKSVFTDFQKCCSFCANHRYYETVNETVLEHKCTASVSTNLTTLLNHLWGLD